VLPYDSPKVEHGLFYLFAARAAPAKVVAHL
jgi:hypothetical protein